MQLTYHTDYSLRLLTYLICRPSRCVTTREMAEFYGISLHHLTKVAKSLTKAGWLTTTRGSGGGLMLAIHTPGAKIGEIVRCTENTDLVECFNPATNSCPIHRCCELKSILFQARRAFFEVLDSFTVQDLARYSAEVNQLIGAKPDPAISDAQSDC